ncbi:MAG: glycosyl hydrolase family 28 protein [Clostridia bacterium]|nr:glycosyl hydrolase family 28 protein [Clostridia bacterium]
MTDRDLQNAIEEAERTGKHLLTVTGMYDISHTVLLPSDFTLVLSDCHLRMTDGSMAQMFRNKGYREGERNSRADADRNIALIGIGRAVLDGGEYNGLSEKNSEKDGLPHISRNSLLLFANVTGFTVKGLQIRSQRYWALTFLYCSQGHICDVDFCADDTYIDQDGTRKHGLSLTRPYSSVFVKNADGIDLRSGCHDVLIENVTGFTEDDTVALTNLSGRVEELYDVTDCPRDIYNIIIRNVRACALCSLVRLLNQNENGKLFNVLVDGLFDASASSPYMDRGLFAVRIGDTHAYGNYVPRAEAVKDIVIRNVFARTAYAVNLSGAMQNVVTDNVRVFDGSQGVLQDLRDK